MPQPASVQYLLDTNILLMWIRWGILQQYLQATYQLDTCRPVPIISVVSEAELRVLALEHGWGGFKRRQMENLLSSVISVPIPYKDSIKAYVELDGFSRKQGIKMGKNDLWIAATAKVEGATLLTTDKDFDHLPESLVKHIYIDPASHL